MNYSDEKLKAIAEHLLIITAKDNYESYVKSMKPGLMTFTDEDVEKFFKLCDSAKISVTWDE